MDVNSNHAQGSRPIAFLASKRFLTGFLITGAVMTFLNLLTYLQSRGAYKADGYEIVGFPFVFHRTGGFAFIDEFHPAPLLADIALGFLLAFTIGYACTRVIMKPTRHRLRLAMGLLICAGGIVLLCFPKAMLFQRLLDGSAWLLIGVSLCFVPEFRLKFSRDWLPLALGLLFGGAGLLFTAVAAHELLGPRSHGFLRFYEVAGVGPLLLFFGVLFGFDKKKAE